MEQELLEKLEQNPAEMQKAQKKKALELLRQLNICGDFIKGFKKEGWTCYYERFIGYWAFQDEELQKKMREIEEKNNCVCYAITHDFTNFGECYSFLLVHNEPEYWDELVQPYSFRSIKSSENKTFSAYSYTWNKTDEFCSDWGDILVQCQWGGLRRVG